MPANAIYILQPIALLVIFVVASYLVFFGPLRRIFDARLIQRQIHGNKKLLLHDLGFTLLNLSIVVTITSYITQWLFNASLLSIVNSPTVTTSVSQFVFYFFAFDLYYYLLHRLLHTRFLYKHVHSHHHKSTRPTPLTSYAVHPLEGLASFMFTIVLFIPLDMSVTALIMMNAYSVIHSMVIHSGHDFFPRWWYQKHISKCYVTPVFHDLHHSDTRGVNFGIYTTIWDRVFGTIAPSLQATFERVTGPVAQETNSA